MLGTRQGTGRDTRQGTGRDTRQGTGRDTGRRLASVGLTALVALGTGLALTASSAAEPGATARGATASGAGRAPGRSAPLRPTTIRPPQVLTTTGTGRDGIRRWLSGAASDQAADGSYGAWRGTPIQIGGTWDNGNDQQIHMYSICPGGPWARWSEPLDVAIGAIDVNAGETWAAAARGSYDARWRTNLQKIKSCWAARDTGLLYLRFAHEMNLDSTPWRVRAGQEPDFVKAITRYSGLRYAILPRARLVLCPNDGTSGSLGVDIRKLWPGRDGRGRPVANVYAVDSYNGYGLVRTSSQFLSKINSTQAGGAPLGLERHRQFAASKGVPFAVSEWSNNGDPRDAGGGGESPTYVREFYAWARAHAGNPARPVAGQLLYEVQFNLWRQFQFWPSTLQPRTAAGYRSLPWGR